MAQGFRRVMKETFCSWDIQVKWSVTVKKFGNNYSDQEKKISNHFSMRFEFCT